MKRISEMLIKTTLKNLFKTTSSFETIKKILYAPVGILLTNDFYVR